MLEDLRGGGSQVILSPFVRIFMCGFEPISRQLYFFTHTHTHGTRFTHARTRQIFARDLGPTSHPPHACTTRMHAVSSSRLTKCT